MKDFTIEQRLELVLSILGKEEKKLYDLWKDAVKDKDDNQGGEPYKSIEYRLIHQWNGVFTVQQKIKTVLECV